MKKQIRINVTARDILLGKPGAACACPIHRAAQRVFRKAQNIKVTERCLHVRTLQVLPTRTYILPKVAQEFIRCFDLDSTRHWVKPFQFTVK